MGALRPAKVVEIGVWVLWCRSLNPSTRWYPIEQMRSEHDGRKVLAERMGWTRRFDTSLEYQLRPKAA